MHQCVLVLQWCIIEKSRFYKKYLKISLLINITLNLALKFSYFLFCDDPLGCEIDNNFALYCGKIVDFSDPHCMLKYILDWRVVLDFFKIY